MENTMDSETTFSPRYLKKRRDWFQYSQQSRDWEKTYRRRWEHDKIVRSTHGVNCTGSCSWQVYVKDGIVTWETQQTDYPSLGPDFPEYEPRGCPRGASYSWYIYSPLRVKYPYVRGELLRLWREVREHSNDPVQAWKDIVSNRGMREKYVKARGKGGFVRTSWEEVSEIISASLHSTIREFGPDRIAGFTPIPAMSMVSYSSGSRFISLIGGTMLSFYDWYADLPPASPQIWGEQTDVPESADWYNSRYFIIWGTNLPMTRTPDAHFMTEARYNGTKVVGVSPDYAEYIKFSDVWLPARAGTDAALALSMAHVIVKEFYIDREEEYFADYAKKYTDLPFLVILKRNGDSFVSDRFLNASDIGEDEKLPEWKPVVWDQFRNAPCVPVGTIGFRWDGSSKWNLIPKDSSGKDYVAELSFVKGHDSVLPTEFPFFNAEKTETIIRGVPVRDVTLKDGSTCHVTTVFDLFVSSLGVDRGFPGEHPESYDDPVPYSPAWQEPITGVDRNLAIKVAREFAENAAKTKGKSMIALGAGTNHWYNSDLIYRSIISLVLLTGSQGVNGGGWAHYVGQEKVRPIEGWSTIAFAGDWARPPRLQNATAFFYLASNQFSYEQKLNTAYSPHAGKYAQMHPLDMLSLSTRLGWVSSYPQFDKSSLDIVQEARKTGIQTDQEVFKYVTEQVKNEKLKLAVTEPDNPVNYPKVLFVWRCNLVGASSKGHEYFLKHMLGTSGYPLGSPDHTWGPENVKVAETPPEGKLDLLINLDFRMTGTSLYSDIVLPAATWYEKYDISSTDLHPYIHPFTPAISSPWETRSDWSIFKTIARKFSSMAEGMPEVEDLVTTALLHDSPDEISQTCGKVNDWKDNGSVPEMGKNFPRMKIVKRDFARVYEKMVTLGPLAEESLATKGVQISGKTAFSEIRSKLPVSPYDGVCKGRPLIEDERNVIEAILTLSGATNGHRSQEEWQTLQGKTGVDLSELAEGNAETNMTLKDLVAQPRVAIATPVWSGSETGGRRYSPFTTNVEHMIPWRTLTGRQHFYLDHEVFLDLAETLPSYKPPLGEGMFADHDRGPGQPEEKHIMVRYLTPHQKWGIHTTYTDNPLMLTLFRGGQVIWLNQADAESIGIKDNDWVEVYNTNGTIVCRAVLTYRIPAGVAMMYHAQDRTIGVPGSEITGDRGGTHNSTTRILMKPTHMVGGYAQLSYFFNYYGPTGNQRDAFAYVRKLSEVKWLES